MEMKYLVVDDSKMARRMTIKSLRKVISDEFEILEASDGKEAVELYKINKPYLCFMDLTMPILDGFEATSQICEYDANANIIVVSADVQEHAIEKAKESGALGFIKKPIDEKDVRLLLESLELL
jgi:CheY-like chemotaxis protein